MSKENQIISEDGKFSKAGDWVKRNQGDIALVAGFTLVAIISFGLGYLSAPGQQKRPLMIEGPQTASIGQQTVDTQTSNQQGTEKTGAVKTDKGIIVASKNGTKYYWPWSSWAKRIKPENLVWFNSESEAQAAGLSRSSDFDQIAPAGYKSQ